MLISIKDFFKTLLKKTELLKTVILLMPSFLNSFYIFRGNYVKKFDYCFDSQKKKNKWKVFLKKYSVDFLTFFLFLYLNKRLKLLVDANGDISIKL